MPLETRRSGTRRLVLAALLAALPGHAVSQDGLPAEATAFAPATELMRPASLSGIAGGSEQAQAERALKDQELAKLRDAMELSAEKQAEIAAEIASLSRDQQALHDQLVTSAARVQALEQSITDSEERLARGAENEARIRASLATRRDVLIAVLSTAQRIGRQPPPALVVSPEDALKAVRSAVVLGAVLPEIRLEAEALQSDLDALVAERTRAAAERDRLRADAASIAEERQRLTLLIDKKKQEGEARAADLAAEKAKAEELAKNARSLEELIAGMKKALPAARPESPAAVAPAPNTGSRLGPAIAFADAKGRLIPPARGVNLQSFGDDNGLGGISQGQSIATRAGARVVSPADGRVVYAGPFRSYGQLLILDAGDDYHVVLAGMERIDVQLDQFVLTGEPVGVMGNQRLASAAVLDASVTQPVLYVEFRKGGTSIDPSPWWVASQDRKVSG
ncbi:murein hydrolase activator EnvC [Pleomorphomonas sp. NRK KF1]|uniref:murein hydrolase activator EnvC family protein n=1 Tax=Pleomorphomonas sp. NRK KF1 TaxID=2943000 RepID=UPI002043197C|nr:peptidoglycan DD-metalloendopeptidase family protein [Pleomorphomonas sp. NRK KF1]MCM5554776.1 peptidoglycan DD-metalloendopeptidase family protein [Pleomorphomonas sp. NRK KF1]